MWTFCKHSCFIYDGSSSLWGLLRGLASLGSLPLVQVSPMGIPNSLAFLRPIVHEQHSLHAQRRPRKNCLQPSPAIAIHNRQSWDEPSSTLIISWEYSNRSYCGKTACRYCLSFIRTHHQVECNLGRLTGNDQFVRSDFHYLDNNPAAIYDQDVPAWA